MSTHPLGDISGRPAASMDVPCQDWPSVSRLLESFRRSCQTSRAKPETSIPPMPTMKPPSPPMNSPMMAGAIRVPGKPGLGRTLNWCALL